VFIGLSVTIVDFGKMADWTEMPFGVMGKVGSSNNVLDGGPHPKVEGTNFWK